MGTRTLRIEHPTDAAFNCHICGKERRPGQPYIWTVFPVALSEAEKEALKKDPTTPIPAGGSAYLYHFDCYNGHTDA